VTRRMLIGRGRESVPGAESERWEAADQGDREQASGLMNADSSSRV